MAPPAQPAPADPAPVVFYDGECGFCARWIQWCLRHDRRGALRFAPLQGTTYAALNFPGKPTHLESMAIHDADGLHLRGNAVLRGLRWMGGRWSSLASVGSVVPRPLRDALYNFIAAHRNKWFAPATSCATPDAATHARFLP